MGPLFHSTVNGISRAELFSSFSLRGGKKVCVCVGGGGGGGGEWHELEPSELFLAPGSSRPEVTCLFIEFFLVLKEAALLPLGSYSSYRLLGKVY